MLLYINSTRSMVRQIDGQAHIVISLDEKGCIRSTDTFFLGDPDCSLGRNDTAELLTRELPFLIEELRLQLELGRMLTRAESAPLMASRRQSMVSGSTVTE